MEQNAKNACQIQRTHKLDFAHKSTARISNQFNMTNPTIVNYYSEKILRVVEEKDNFTQSDLQGVIDAIVIEILNHK